MNSVTEKIVLWDWSIEGNYIWPLKNGCHIYEIWRSKEVEGEIINITSLRSSFEVTSHRGGTSFNDGGSGG